jgi:hypothetical protein
MRFVKAAILVLVLLAPSYAAGPPLERFMSQLKQAYSQRDSIRLNSLFNWEGIAPASREKIEKVNERSVALRVKSIDLVQPLDKEFNGFAFRGKCFEYNLRVEKMAVIKFEPGQGTTEAHVPVGKLKNGYAVAVSRQVPCR